VLGNSTTKIN
jgi:FtsZ-binding cell division protein ZapB